MNNIRGNNRRRGRGGGRQQGGGQQLNRIDSRARGNAPQLLEKYRKLAHDAHLNGDRVTEEYYLQFADHYFRVIADTRQRQEEARQRRDERWQDSSDGGFRDEGEDRGEFGGESEFQAYDQAPSYTARQEREERPRREEREERDDEETRGEEGGEQRSAYEPAENPFLRENRAGRGLRPRRDDRRQRREAPAERGEEEPAALDPASLPPSISASREEPAAVTAEEGEAKPRRRTRRTRPPVSEELEAVSQDQP